jgi:hypothetical protein
MTYRPRGTSKEGLDQGEDPDLARSDKDVRCVGPET